jgi:hypothetical protein
MNFEFKHLKIPSSTINIPIEIYLKAQNTINLCLVNNILSTKKIG